MIRCTCSTIAPARVAIYSYDPYKPNHPPPRRQRYVQAIQPDRSSNLFLPEQPATWFRFVTIGNCRRFSSSTTLPCWTWSFRPQPCIAHFHNSNQVQVCKLISIKTGGCPEDCKYCSQSSRYETEINASPLMPTEEVLAIAQRAKDAG